MDGAPVRSKPTCGCLGIFCIVGIVLMLVGLSLGPINRPRRASGGNLFAFQARQIQQAMEAYAMDHNNVYPYGKTSTEVFQKLLDGGYIKDTAVFYLEMAGKSKGSSWHRLKPENVSFDVTIGMKWWHNPPDLPLVFSTGYQVTYAPGAVATPIYSPPVYHDGDLAVQGIAVAYLGNGSRFLAAGNPGGAIPNFVSPDFRPDKKVYYQLMPDLPGGSVEPLPSAPASPSSTPPVAGQPWTNKWGVTFLPAGTDGVLFSIWDVRVKDFRAFVAATGYDATHGMIRNGTVPWQSHGITWDHPGIPQTEDDPVVKVSWNDAQAFCQWLTAQERFTAGQRYRLPTDAQWSAAAGLEESGYGSPLAKGMQNLKLFSWGTAWPPPAGVGNYDASPDAYGTTSPVGSFAANKYGLYDMGGNVWQWCEDAVSNSHHERRILRGGSWEYEGGNVPPLSRRDIRDPGMRAGEAGFRVVLQVGP